VRNYYEHLEVLRRRLREVGEREVANELLQAERGGMTSGEILSNTAVILQRLLKSGEADRLQLRDEIAGLDHLREEIWGSGNRRS